jgi:hypothetical protein
LSSVCWYVPWGTICAGPVRLLRPSTGNHPYAGRRLVSDRSGGGPVAPKPPQIGPPTAYGGPEVRQNDKTKQSKDHRVGRSRARGVDPSRRCV